jgi:hypothetical protein
MRFKIVVVMLAVAVLSFAAVGPAAAQPLGPANGHIPTRPPQVSGAQLQMALLPPSAFGSGFTFWASLNTGSKLQTTQAKDYLPGMSCNAFESKLYVAFFGDTAGAVEKYTNPAPRATYPNTIIDGDEDVLQFATAAAATSFYTRAEAKYAACRSFTESIPGEDIYQVSTLSVAQTNVGGDRAFLVTEALAVSGYRVVPLYDNFLYVVGGTNVYSFGTFSGTNDEPSPALMANLIHRVQALYPHH